MRPKSLNLKNALSVFIVLLGFFAASAARAGGLPDDTPAALKALYSQVDSETQKVGDYEAGYLVWFASVGTTEAQQAQTLIHQSLANGTLTPEKATAIWEAFKSSLLGRVVYSRFSQDSSWNQGMPLKPRQIVTLFDLPRFDLNSEKPLTPGEALLKSSDSGNQRPERYSVDALINEGLRLNGEWAHKQTLNMQAASSVSNETDLESAGQTLTDVENFPGNAALEFSKLIAHGLSQKAISQEDAQLLWSGFNDFLMRPRRIHYATPRGASAEFFGHHMVYEYYYRDRVLFRGTPITFDDILHYSQSEPQAGISTACVASQVENLLNSKK